MTLRSLADYVARRTDALLARWREEARADERQPCRRLHLSDADCDNHLPALIDALVQALGDHGASAEVEKEGAEHGRQRRRLGYTVIEVMEELTLFRQVVLNVVEDFQAETQALSQKELADARKRLLDLLDASVKASVAEYVTLAEQERDRMMGQLRESNEQKDRFLAMLSHELRNPLAPILNAARVLREIRTADPRLDRARDIIERQARYQARLLDDLLEVNRIARGKIALQCEEVIFQSAVRHAIDASQPGIEAKHLRLEVELPREGLVVLGDPTRLAQIATNILTNAVKFTPASGSVRLTVIDEAGELIMRIRDTGIGISSEMLPHVFEMFAQADTSLDRSGGGLGLGLALAKSLVEMQGGGIEARSEGVGKGAEFVVRFPLLRRESATREEVPHLYFGKRVALVEDNDDARHSLTSLLESMGLTVLPARDAHEALKIAAQENPDAFVVDIGLPGMNGYELARVVRKLPGIQERLLIALTGYGSPEEKKRAAEAGFDHHLTKPADVDELYRLLTASS